MGLSWCRIKYSRELRGLGARRAIELAVLALFAACVFAPQAAAQPAPPYFVGIQSWDDPTRAELDRLKRVGAISFRINLRWSRVERTRGRYTWRYYDRLFLMAARRGIRVLPVLLASPSWVCNPTCSRHVPQYPPRTAVQRRHFVVFAHRAARRYGPNGSFWNGKAVAPSSRPVWFQVWNEPNIPNYWNRAPNAVAYAQFLGRTGRVLKHADPSVKVLAAGLPDSGARGDVIRMAPFIRRMFSVPGVADVVDAVAIHPYGSVETIVGRIRAARGAMRASLGGRTKPTFLTEFGWATAGRGYVTTRQGQARQLRRAYGQLLANRQRYRLEGAYWFNLKDHRAPKPRISYWWGYYTGLFDRHGNAKPSWREFVRVVRGR